MQITVANLVLLSTLLVVSGEPQIRRYPAVYAPIFRNYHPDVLQAISPDGPARILFLETTTFTTVTVTSTRNCRYSTAGLTACRRRRSVEEDPEFIAPSAVLSVIPTQEASMDDVRDKRQLRMGGYFPYISDYIEPSIDMIQPGAGGYLPFQEEGRLFFRMQTVTSTSTLTVTNVQSTLVTCAPLTGFLYSQC